MEEYIKYLLERLNKPIKEVLERNHIIVYKLLGRNDNRDNMFELVTYTYIDIFIQNEIIEKLDDWKISFLKKADDKKYHYIIYNVRINLEAEAKIYYRNLNLNALYENLT